MWNDCFHVDIKKKHKFNNERERRKNVQKWNEESSADDRAENNRE